MIALDCGEIAALVGGRTNAPDVVVDGPATVDSRQVPPGGLFAAFAGEHADGHDYAPNALAAGAAVALVSRPVDGPHILVDDVLAALTTLASHTVRRLIAEHGLVVIGITGSQGKTSTKDLLAQILRPHGATVAAHGSFNNDLGVPLTALRADRRTRYLVVEMGARGIGHIARLCAIAPPTIGVVLNVGDAHRSEFGSRAGTARAKAELPAALPADGTAVLNADDPLVAPMATPARVLTFGSTGELRAAEIEARADGGHRFDLVHGDERHRVELDLLGGHHVPNALAAAGAALASGLSVRQIAAALGEVRSLSPMRMERLRREDGLLIVNDAYNANPSSTAAALEALAGLAVEGRRIAVLGPMRELGDAAPAGHHRIGELAARRGIDLLLAVGEDAAPIAEGFGPGAVRAADTAEALAYLLPRLDPADAVLVKASRSERLERVVTGLLGAARHNPA